MYRISTSLNVHHSAASTGYTLLPFMEGWGRDDNLKGNGKLYKKRKRHSKIILRNLR